MNPQRHSLMGTLRGIESSLGVAPSGALPSRDAPRSFGGDLRKLGSELTKAASWEPVTYDEVYAVRRGDLPAPGPAPTAPSLTGGPGDDLRKLAHAVRVEAHDGAAARREKVAAHLPAIEGLTLLRELVRS